MVYDDFFLAAKTASGFGCFFAAGSKLHFSIKLQLQAYFLVHDDIEDGCHKRRGQPCWFRLPKVRAESEFSQFSI